MRNNFKYNTELTGHNIVEEQQHPPTQEVTAADVLYLHSATLTAPASLYSVPSD